MGTFWRRESSGNYENFYIRPHQSGNVDANQYNPVFNGSSSWQLYHGEGYGAPVDYVFDEWMHIKIVVAGNRCEVFIMDMETPTVEISALKRHQKAGQIGLSVANYIDAYFANFTFTSLDNPVLKGNFKSESKVEKGIVKFWDVSNTFNEKILNNVKSLTNNEMENLSWDKLEAEETGLVNLAMIADIRKDNTVFARVIIDSDEEQSKEFNFGYSDRVKVFLNDELYYSGSNLYRSRDYRYLGTIGYFDSVHLHLKKGKNILIIAITEEYGGWGLQGKFPNSSGIKIR